VQPKTAVAAEVFFDTVLVTGYAWDDMEKCFWPGQCPLPMNSTDWLRILDIWAEQSIASVNNASSAAAVVTKVVVALMYPDTRQNAFGIIDGRLLNFSITDDRVTAVKWWMSLLRTVVQSVPFRSIELVGWYWYLEDIPDYDRDVIKSVADLAHDEGELLTWIPSYDGSAGDGIWKDVGFDFIMQQPNYAFRDTTKLRFMNVSILMDKFTTGVELELGLTVRNHLINLNATQSFYDYLNAALLLDWMDGAVKSYYTGNDFIVMSQSSNATIKHMYDDLCKFVNGRYVATGA